MIYRIEKRGIVNVLVFEQGCRPASIAEAQMWEEITNLRARLEKAENEVEQFKVLVNASPALYKIEIQRGSKVWIYLASVRARDQLCAINRAAKGIFDPKVSAIRATREYKE